MKKWGKLGKEAEDFLAFPILAALARRPLSTKELTHSLLVSQSAILKRLHQLEELGYVVQRASDSRWVMMVRLMAVGAPAPSGVEGVTPAVDQAPLRSELVPGNVILEPSVGPQEEQEGAQVSACVPVMPEGSERRVDIEGVAAKVAARFGVPVTFDDLGAANVGIIAGCVSCQRKTPLKYGGTALCPACARVWGAVGKESEVSDVQNEAR